MRYFSRNMAAFAAEKAQIGRDPAARGLFQDIIDALAERGGQLPDDDEKLARLLDYHLRTFRRLWAKVKQVFIVAGGCVRHRLVDQALGFFAKQRGNPSPKPLKTNSAAVRKDSNPLSDRESDRGSPPDVREDAPAATPASPPLRSRKRPRPTKRRAWPSKAATSPLPDNWMPNPAGIAFAQSKGLTNAEINFELERFEFHHRKSREQWADWGAAWCGWIVLAPRFAERRRTRDEQRAESTRRSDEAIYRAAQRSAARHGASDRGWAQTIAGNAAG
jgi:hypothetical protein